MKGRHGGEANVRMAEVTWGGPWDGRIAELDCAFQAIVNVHTGRCFGCEVLLRGAPVEEFGSIAALLDAGHAEGRLADVELAVRRAAARKAGTCDLTMFFNLDFRAAQALRDIQRATRQAFVGHSAGLVTEIVGHQEWVLSLEWVGWLKKHRGLIGIDRFGDGGDALRLLHQIDPDILKIDRYYVADVDTNARKRVMMAAIVNLAHTLGVTVVAVGVETEREFLVCRELGCDMVQGFYIQPPVGSPAEIPESFDHVEAVIAGDRKRRQIDQKWISDQVDRLPPVEIVTPLAVVFERLARDTAHHMIPVVDSHGQPLGIVRERSLKNLAYSTFGKDLIANKGIGRSLRDYLVRCPIAEISTSLDQLLAIFSNNEEAEGVLITDQTRYLGFLNARSIIRAMHEKTLARARDENPLTKLPGNDMITEFVAHSLHGGGPAVLVYLDFDNFKPFNDTYGFRQGDRAILLFADLMRKAANPETWFLGHIGGDDFFVGMRASDVAQAVREIGEMIRQFASDAESFYDAEARERGAIVAADREGNMKTFPLLSVSAVLVEVDRTSPGATVDDVSALIAGHKKAAKASPSRMVCTSLSVGLTQVPDAAPLDQPIR